MKYLKLFEEYEQSVKEERSFKGNTVKELLKAAKRKMGTESFLVQDMDGVDWAVFIDGDTKPGDREVYAMDQYDNEKMVDIKTINLIYEGELIVRNDSLNEDQDFVVTGFKGGYSSNSERWDWIVSAKNKAEAKKKVQDRKGKLRGISATPVSDYKSLNPYSVFQRLDEAATKDYDPPKFLVLPALDPEGNGIPSDKIDAYMRAELAKRKSYYKPGIRSANPPKRGEEVDRNLDEANININAKPKTRPFNKVKPGNVGLDFYDRVWTVIGTGKYSELEKFDDAGLSDGFENDDDCVAVKSDDRLKTAVYTYGEEGFRVFEGLHKSINENRFKEGKGMFGYRIDPKRTKLKPEVIATLADVVKEFTEAYKSIEDRDRNIFDLTDALQKEIERLDKKYWRSLRWDEENIATTIIDAFKNGLAAQKPNIKVITAMLSELPLDSGWG